MSKLTRVFQKVFGALGGTSDFGEFGSLALGSPTTSKDVTAMQSLAPFDTGLQDATIGDFIPAYQDMNTLFYILYYQMCYLLQMGIAEYDSSTVYYINSIVQSGGVWYKSLIDNNTGNTPSTSPSDWQCVNVFGFGANVASASSMTLGNDGNSFKITGTTSINNITIKPTGTIVQLVFTGALTVNTGGNILLNSGAFTTVANSTLTLVSDGTSWFELSRSPAFSGVGTSVANSIGGGPYQALTDGYVVAWANCTGVSEAVMELLTDSSPSPSTVENYSRTNFPSSGVGEIGLNVSFMVKKGNYYQVTLGLDGSISTSGMTFTPLGQ